MMIFKSHHVFTCLVSDIICSMRSNGLLWTVIHSHIHFVKLKLKCNNRNNNNYGLNFYSPYLQKLSDEKFGMGEGFRA